MALPVPDTAATPDIIQAAVSGGFELCFHVIAPLVNWSFPTPLNPQSSSGEIVVRGARLHNLKNLTLSIPHNKLTVITGVSGSGKSSLAFDTIYAEGQRRYIESLSAYARQFLERMEKPAVDEIEGIAPGIAIRQKNTTAIRARPSQLRPNLRLHAPALGARRVARSARYADAASSKIPSITSRRPCWRSPRARAITCCSRSQHEPGSPLREGPLNELRTRGFNRLWQNGTVFEFSTPESLLDIDWKQPVPVLADRIAIAPDVHQRIVDTVEACYREAGEVVFEDVAHAGTLLFSERFLCKYDNIEFREPEPILFSFNSPAGACPRCQGFGNTIDYSHGSRRSQPRPLLERRSHRAMDQAQRRRMDVRFPQAGRRPGPLRRTLLRSHRSRAADWSSKATQKSTAFASSSTTSKPKNTSCTCASFSAGTGATRAAPNAPVARSAKKPST